MSGTFISEGSEWHSGMILNTIEVCDADRDYAYGDRRLALARFPQALIIIPAGVCVILLLDCGRIVALVLIAHAGAPQVALGVFDSQAGWIAFNAIALGLVLPLPRWSFFTHGGSQDSSHSQKATANNQPFGF